jgi:hypothetical protein
MGQTTKYHLRYPELVDPADAHLALQNLANDVEAALGTVLATTPVILMAAPASVGSIPANVQTVVGMTRYITSGATWDKSGGAYIVPFTGFYRVTGQATFASSGSVVDQGRNVAVRRNGSIDLCRGYTLAHSLSATCLATNIVQLTAGDLIDMTVSTSVACSLNMNPYTLLLAELIPGATA